MINGFTPEQWGRLSKKLDSANKKNQISKKISIASKMGYNYYAGIIARENGMYKQAFENFAKIDFLLYLSTKEVIFPVNPLKSENIDSNEYPWNLTSLLKLTREEGNIFSHELIRYKN